MGRRIAIIQGHPDPSGNRFGHALADAYRAGAQEAGHEVRVITVAQLDFPLLRSQDDWQHNSPPAPIREAQDTIAWAEHLVIMYPLWLGTMPALMKGFLEQALRPGFALGAGPEGLRQKQLTGRTARVVVTMGMPSLVYRWYFRAHSLKSLERNILKFCGIGPIKETLFGLIEGSGEKRAKWLGKMRALGQAGK